MALLFKYTTENYQLAVWKIEETEEALLQLLSLTKLPEYKHSSRRLDYLAARAASHALGIVPAQIHHHTSGKPLTDTPNLHLSLSHTRGYAAAVCSASPFIGVDLEIPSNRIHRIRKRFLHPSEQQALTNVHPEQETEMLFCIWCAKESMFKALSEEGVDFATELEVRIPNALAEKGQCSGTAHRSGINFEIDYWNTPELILTCCFSAKSK